MLPVPRIILLPCVILVAIFAAHAYYIAEWSGIEVTIDNQTEDYALVCVYLDGESFEDLEIDEMMDDTSDVDFKEIIHVRRGSHTVQVKIVDLDHSFSCTLDVGMWQSTKLIELRLTPYSLERI